MTDGDESILVVTQFFPPETGAAASRWEELTSRWSDSASVTVITSAPDYPEGELHDGYENQWLRRERRDGVDVFYTMTIPSSSGNLVWRALKFVWFMFISAIVGLRYTSPTAVVATSPPPLTGVSAWVIARWNRAAFIFEVRDLWPESVLAVSDFDNKLVIWLLDRTVSFLYRRADRVVVLSEAFIDSVTACGADRSDIVYHPNGIELSFYEDVTESDVVPDRTEDTFTVTYVGTIGRAHGLSVVLEAAPKLPNVQFLLVGDGAERDTLEERASDIENVVFPGLVPKSEVPGILEASDVALVHLKPRDIFETVLPSKQLEAMAAGLPIVLGVRGEAQRILSEADAGLAITPGDADELVATVERLKQNPEQRQRFGENGREYAVTNFDWDTISRDYRETLTAAGNRVTRRT